MSSIVTSLTGGGGKGMGFEAQHADITNPVTKQQLDNAGTATDTGLDNQQAFLQALQQQNGLGNQSSVFNQQQAVANGQGPNPAQAQLANATGANVANQAALMAGQRGSGANVGMLVRQAAQQGANTQQQAAGQGAALQAGQSLNALNQMGGIANQQAGQQANATNAYTNAALQNQQNLLGAQGQFNNAQVGATSSMNSANGALANTVAKGEMDLVGNLAGGAGAALMEAGGGLITDPAAGPQSNAARHFLGQPKMMMAEGGQVPALVSPGEKYLAPQAVEKVAKGADPMSVGETIPGKAKVKGAKNSYANDTVPKNLEEGGIIIPRHITMGKHPGFAAKKFVDAILAKNSGLKPTLKKSK